MAVRSKMSTARSRGRAVVRTTSEELPKEKPKDYSKSHEGSPRSDKDFSIADLTPEDEALIRKQYRLSDNEDFVIPKADYDVWKSTGKKSPEDYGKEGFEGKPNPFQSNYEGERTTRGLKLQLYGKGQAPKAKPDPNNMREAARKVKPLDKFATLKTKKIEPGATRDLVVKEKAAKEDIQVPEQVSGPKGRTVTRKKLAKGVKRTSGTLTLRGNAAKSGQTNKSFSGSKQRTKEAKDTLKLVNVNKEKGPRLSEKMKYKKEEKLAGARERVLGMSGVETEDRNVFYNKKRNKSKDLNEKQTKKYSTGVTSVKRGEKTPGSAQRLKDIKNLYDTSSVKYKDEKGVERTTGATSAEKIYASTAPGKFGSDKRVKMLKEAKSDIKEIGKLSKAQIKGTRKEGSAKGRALVKAKEMKAEYKAAKRPAKFSKGTSTEALAKDVAAMKSTKTAAELKAMKTSAKSAMKEARGMTKTKQERSSTRSSVKNNRELAREARSYKGDIRKGLRMEKRDMLAEKVAAKTSDAKKARKADKGRTMRGTSYFSMTELNKTVPLSKTTSSKKQAGTKRYSK